MAMKLGGEAKSELIFPGHVEKPGEVSEAVAALIAARCESYHGRFRKM
jgi:hypothetical protein